ncbi:hypothetical protein Asp14428_02900 [Actinoplanes sp. NBRC 14428]|nr:hypothetical protein Asp14428_02900 [Actinoplanes sp. NBRC 14428]
MDYRAVPREPWVRPSEIADSLRCAAIAGLLLDTRAGRADLVAAGHAYHGVGLPFGDFLLVAGTGSGEVSARAAGRIEAMLSGEEPEEDAAQLRYLLLAAAPDAPALGPAWERAARRYGPLLAGSASQPFATWWQMGSLLSRLEPGDEETRSELAGTIVRVAEAHGQQLEFAMTDRYHWSTGHSRVDLVDLDLAGTVAISVRTMAARGIRPWHLGEEFTGLRPAARVSIVIGLQLGGDDPDSGDRFPGDPHGPAPSRYEEGAFRYGVG